jgi:hypothetical protein
MESFFLFPEYPALSILVLLVVSMVFLYFAREPMHRLLTTLREGLAGGLAKIADGARATADRWTERSRKVLLETGLDQVAGKLEQEIHRLDSAYTRRLADYPDLHRDLEAAVRDLESDYKDAGQVPPEAPGWGEVVASLSQLQESEDRRSVVRILKEVHRSVESGQRRALDEYRDQSARRHKVLGRLAPVLRDISRRLEKVGKAIGSVLETTSRLDTYIERFDELRSGEESSIESLSARTTRQFFLALLVLGVAVVAAAINFQLIALPMSELVPAGARILGLPVIVALEVVVGIFLLDALGITTIFPKIAAMERRNRRLVLATAFTALFFLAAVEASLAVLREYLVESEMTLRQALAGSQVPEAGLSALPVAGQATLGFILPWILALLAVPLEMLLESGQHVTSRAAAGLLALVGHLSRFLSYLVGYVIQILGHLYDAYIVLPAQLAQLWESRDREGETKEKKETKKKPRRAKASARTAEAKGGGA